MEQKPEMLILLDENHNEIGYEEKLKCHMWPAKRHRAFSAFIFNSKDEMLITRRALDKYHWGGFWTNACCSHPRKGETPEQAGQRRMKEELGFSCPLKHVFTFEYSARFDEKWGEHEVDWVLTGRYDGPVKADKSEVAEWKFVSVDELRADMLAHPQNYTPWFKESFDRVVKTLL